VKFSPLVLPGVVLCFALMPAGAQTTDQRSPDPSAQPPSTQGAPPAAPSATAQNPATDTSRPSQDQKGQDQSGTSKDRLFFALPNFLTLENAGQVPPLTAGQKFKVVARSSFDYVQVPWYAFLAGVSQATDSEEGFGQGAEGYGKRLGSYVADGTIENFMTGAILPSLLRQDPRYFQSGKGSFMHRTGYSVSRIFITRGDSGRQQFNYSEVFGSALASGISTYSYHPREDRNLGNVFSVWGSQVGYDTITLVIKEFWPDIRRKMQRKKHTGQ
jgi:hypothetical protein